ESPTDGLDHLLQRARGLQRWKFPAVAVARPRRTSSLCVRMAPTCGGSLTMQQRKAQSGFRVEVKAVPACSSHPPELRLNGTASSCDPSSCLPTNLTESAGCPNFSGKHSSLLTPTGIVDVMLASPCQHQACGFPSRGS